MWNWAIYGALLASALLVAGALALLAVRVLQGWRDLKRLRRHVFRDLDRLFEKVEAGAEKAAALAETSRIEETLAHLRASLARFAILRDAWADATAFTAFIPRK